MVETVKAEGICGKSFGVFVKHWTQGCSVYCYHRSDGAHTLVSYPDWETQSILRMFCASCPESSASCTKGD